MANVTPATMRGLLTMDRRYSNGAISRSGVNGASYTQAGGMAGRPVAVQSTGLAELQASGTQADGSQLEMYAVRGGNAGPVPGSALNLGSAAFAWRNVGDTYWRGWDPPSTISAYEFVDRSTTAAAWKDPHVLATSDGTIYCITQEANRYVTVWKRPVSSGVWASTRVYDSLGTIYTGAVHAAPCLVALPSGRLVALFWLYDASGSGVASSMSDDDGATWSTPQLTETTLGAAGYVVTRIRAAYLSGQVCMLATTVVGAIDAVIQFASVDGGASFTLVNVPGDWQGGYAEIVAHAGAFVACSINPAATTTGSNCLPRSRRWASAFTSGATATGVYLQDDAETRTWGTVAAGLLTAADLSMCVDQNDTLWVIGSNYDVGHGALREYYTTRSEDGGSTWALVGKSGARAWWRGLDNATHPQDVTVCAQGGRLVVLSNQAANPGTADDSLCGIYLGGSTAIGQPQMIRAVSLQDYSCGQSVTWLPWDLPQNTGATWTPSGGGAPTLTFTALGLRVQHAVIGDSQKWTATPTTTNAQGIVAMMECRVVAGTARLGATISGGANGYAVEIEVTPTTIVLRDVVAGTTVNSATTTAGASGVQVKFGLGDDTGGANQGKVYAYYRATSTNADRNWIFLGRATAFTGYLQRSATVTTDSVYFETASGTATGDYYFRQVAYAAGADAGVNLYTGQALEFPTGTLGQTFGAAPSPLAETGVKLAMTDGPAKAGDQWTISTQYRYPISRIDPMSSPSPDAKWRSTSDASEALIVWSLTEATRPEGQLWGVYVDGANWSTATVEGWDGAAWVVLGTLSLVLGSSLRFLRAGEIVTVNPLVGSGDVDDYIQRDALRGCIWRGGGGATPRYIRTNSGGRWVGSAVISTTRPVVVLDTFDVADTAAGSAASLTSPRGCLILRTTTAYSRLALRIPAQSTPDGFFTLGAAVIGPIAWLGNYDFARQMGIETNIETIEAGNGSRRKRKQGKPRRYAQIAWTDGIDTSNTHDTAPDYIEPYTGGTPMGGPAAIATDVLGLVMANDVSPVVYLPRLVVPGSAAVSMVKAYDLMLYGTIETDTIQMDTVVGDEHLGSGTGELVRVGTMRIDEQL